MRIHATCNMQTMPSQERRHRMEKSLSIIRENLSMLLLRLSLQILPMPILELAPART